MTENVEAAPGSTSDGYHTFDELYRHRAVLFAALCAAHPDKAWKSRLHNSGDMYDGMFIAGIETPKGQATYHIEEEHWKLFKCRELERAPEWDGHTPEQALERLKSLANIRPPKLHDEYGVQFQYGRSKHWHPLEEAHVWDLESAKKELGMCRSAYKGNNYRIVVRKTGPWRTVKGKKRQ